MPTVTVEAEHPAAVGGLLPQSEPAADGFSAVDVDLWAVVLAGGIGSRFWPLSTAERPKALLALVGERPLIADTLARLAPVVPAERVLVVTSRDIARATHGAIPDVPWENMLVEPRPLGTAAALAWAASAVARRAGARAMCLVTPSDLAVAYPEAFRSVIRRAAGVAASHHALTLVGVQPTRPETGFGYILPERPAEASGSNGGAGPFWVRDFVEKPAHLRAAELIADGALWNAGLLVAEAGVVLDGLREHTFELGPGLPALAAGDTQRFAGMIQSVSIERGLLERSGNVVVLRGEFGWDDVGTWACLRRTRELDDHGNGVRGRAYLVDSSSNVVHSESGSVVLYGVSKMLVVSLDGLTFVTTLERATDLKPLLDALPGSMRMKPR